MGSLARHAAPSLQCGQREQSLPVLRVPRYGLRYRGTRCRQRWLTHLLGVGHLGVVLVPCGCGSSFQSAGISNSSAGTLAVSMEVVSVVSDTTRISGPDGGGVGVGAPPGEDPGAMELAVALAAGSAASLAALEAAAPPA